MKLILDQFILKTDKLDKLLIVLIFFSPFLLSISIFLADLFISLAGIVVLFLLFQKKYNSLFSEIKKEIYFFSTFYFLLIISLIFSISFEQSFLPSFFYFRYFLLVLAIYYLLKKYDFFCKILLYSICFTFLLVLSDATFQYFFFENFLGYSINKKDLPEAMDMKILTGFFNDEKKLGSYLVRLLPLLVSLLYYFKLKKLNYFFLILTGAIIFFTSERTALFLFIIFSFFYFLIIKKKIQFIILSLLILGGLFTFNKPFKYKYFDYTLMQLGVIQTHWNKADGDILRYYSKEHEDLSYTALQIFKKNILTGSGMKTFYIACNKMKKEKGIIPVVKGNDTRDVERLKINPTTSFLNRSNNLKCSTHPHSTYAQILSDTGIFSFIFVLTFFMYVLRNNIRIIFKKTSYHIDYCFYFLNVGIILNLFPLIPSGNFYNNWLSIILFYPIGLWLYMSHKIKKDE